MDTSKQPGRLTVLDETDIYQYNTRTHKYRSIFYNKSNQSTYPTQKPISMAYDEMGFLYVGDGKTSKIDLYSPMKFLYVNLFVQVEQVYLRLFSQTNSCGFCSQQRRGCAYRSTKS